MGDGGPGGTSSDGGGRSSPARDEPGPDDVTELGGDPVCWLDRVCDRCGGLSDGAPAARCDRCGAATR